MISYQNALEMIRTHASKVKIMVEEVPLEASIGRVTARDLVSEESVPPFDNSAMDGFAIFAGQTEGASSDSYLRLRVVRTIAAGDLPTSIEQDQVAVEIMTGAPVPKGAFDAVVKVEDVEVKRDGNGDAVEIMISHRVAKGENLRRAGEDYRPGQLILPRGTIINTAHLMALATLGVTQVPVQKKPKVAVISTGREIIHHSSKRLEPGTIRNSTGPYLMAVLREFGADGHFYGTVKDDEADFIDVMNKVMADQPDLVISTGAVSMGKYDFVKPALEKLGAEIVFHKTAIRPGKPILFARLAASQTVFFGVPGNPISTAVGFRFFVVPYLQLISGLSIEKPATAALVEECKKPDGLKCFFKAETYTDDGRLFVKALPGQASFMISPFTRANSWVVLDERGSLAQKGSAVQVLALNPNLDGGVFP